MDPTHPHPVLGREALQAHAALLTGAFAGAQLTLLDVLAEGDTAAIRWMAQAHPPAHHVLEAVTWLHLVDDGIAEARTLMDGAAFLWPSLHAATPQPALVTAHADGASLSLAALDSRGEPFELTRLRGRVACLLCASRRVQSGAQEVAEALGAAFGGDDRVALLLLLDGSDVPAPLRPVARAALATLRAQAVRRFHEGFRRAHKPTPPHVEELVWLLPDFDGDLFVGLGLQVPLAHPVLMVVDPAGRIAGQWKGDPAALATDGIAAVRAVLP